MNKTSVIVAVFVAALSVAPAWAVNITIPDTNPGSGSFFSGGPVGVGGEDQETEPNTIADQSWDLEAVLLTDTTLSLVGGWNWLSGQADSRGDAPGTTLDNWDSGDVFLALDTVAAPLYGATAPNSMAADGFIDLANTFGYNYVLDIDWENPNGNNVNFTVYQIDSATLLSAYFDQNEESNPFRYREGGTLIDTGVATLTSYNTDVYGLLGGYHNELSINLADLPGFNEIWVHNTQECGNDNLMGHHVPDGGLTALLLCMAMSGVPFVRRKLAA